MVWVAGWVLSAVGGCGGAAVPAGVFAWYVGLVVVVVVVVVVFDVVVWLLYLGT